MRKIKRFCNYLCIIFLVFLAVVHQTSFADSPEAYVLNENAKPANIGIFTHYIEDKDGTLFIEDIIKADHAKATSTNIPEWQPAPPDGLAEGFTESVYWLRFSISNTSAEAIRWYLEFRYPILDSIEYFSPNGEGEYTRQIAGDAYPFDQRTIDYRNIVFAQNTPASTHQTFYVRIDTSSSMFVPLYVWPHDTFFHEIDKVKLLLGILYGIVILALAISAVNAVFLKDIMYIWLSGIFICFFLYLGGIKGVAFQSLWPNSLYWQEISIPFFMNMSVAFGFLYCRAYINLREYSAKLDAFIKYFAIVGFIASALSFVVEYRYIISFSTVITMVSQVTCLSVGIYSWSRGNTAARLFVLSWTALFLGAVSFALIALGSLPKTFITEWMQEIGFGSMVTLMIIAQFDRFLQIQKSHERNRVKSLEAIKDAEKKYRSLFENAIEGIFQMDSNGVLSNVNTAYARILGIEDPELLVETRDTPFTLGFMSESEGDKLRAMLNSQGALNDYNISFASPAGEIRWASIALQKVQPGSNGDFHYEGSLTDITETKKREQAEKHRRMAEASTEAKSMFLANMSHEIRTPMNAIIGFTDLAVNANQDKNLAEFLRKIKTASSNLLGIINDILDFSKIEAGKLKIEAIPFSLRELMNNINDIVEENIKSKGLSFDIDIDEDIPETLIGDSLRLHQIILNLTNNAVKFTSEGSVKVEIDLLAMNKKKGTIKLEGRVIDTGIGISQEQQNKLFTSFSQADESTTRNFGGTGLGLSISKQLISLMGGDITVRSIENQGSVFEFNFQCRLESRKHKSANSNSKLNILIVDDNDDSRLLTENVINELEHAYTSTNSSSEAIEVLEASHKDGLDYDLLLIDWLMPVSDGFDCLKKIQELSGDEMPKSVLITTYGEEGLKERAINAGFDAYVEKPVKKAHIQQVFNSIFNSASNLFPAEVIKQATPRSNIESGDIQNSHVENESEESGINFKGIKALVVDDIPMNQELAREILRKQGISVSIAGNGEQGTEKARSQEFDVILMDMQMPVMDGCEATIAIREFDEEVPIIAMTANAMTEDKKRCLSVGMNDFVTKPINSNALFATLAKHLPRVEIVETTEPGNQTASTEQVSYDPIPEQNNDDANQDSTAEDSVSPSQEEAIQSALAQASTTQASTAQSSMVQPAVTTLPVSLPSIDLQDGLERCQGNQKLYLKLLGDFIRNYETSSQQMHEMLENRDLTSISRLAHTLKGLSANLGAKALSKQAMTLESVESYNEGEQKNAIEAFETLLSSLVSELHSLLSEMNSNSETSSEKKASYSPQERIEFIDQLSSMVNEQKMDAYDQALEAAEKWPDELGKDELNELIEQLDLFEFEAAKASIEIIKQKIQ